MSHVEFEILKGKTLIAIVGATAGSDQIEFYSDAGDFVMYHHGECCESVQVEDIAGDIADLIGSPILLAEESSNSEILDGKPANPYSFTWTFYKLATAKGHVTLRWLGSSNGYYSESVSFEEKR